MMVLCFCVDNERYSLDCRNIIEVIPRIPVRKLAHTPPEVAGLINFRSETVPVIDITYLLKQRPTDPYLSSRIAVVHYPGVHASPRHTLGLLLEQAHELVQIEETQLNPPGVTPSSAPYLGDVYQTDESISQYVKVSELLPDSLKAVLFQTPQEKPSEAVSPVAIE